MDRRIANIVAIGRADQREIAFVGNGKYHAAVGVLEQVGAVVVEQLGYDDMRALHQAHVAARALMSERARRPLRPMGLRR